MGLLGSAALSVILTSNLVFGASFHHAHSGSMLIACGATWLAWAHGDKRGLSKMIRQFSVAAEQTVLLCPCDAVLDLAFSFALI